MRSFVKILRPIVTFLAIAAFRVLGTQHLIYESVLDRLQTKADKPMQYCTNSSNECEHPVVERCQQLCAPAGHVTELHYYRRHRYCLINNRGVIVIANCKTRTLRLCKNCTRKILNFTLD